MSEKLIIALIGSATTIAVAALPIVLQKWLGSKRPDQGAASYHWASVLAVGFSVVAILVALWPRPFPRVQTYWAQTEPAHGPAAIETEATAQARDFRGMFRYTVNFPEPVDVVVPQQLSYTNNWVIWSVARHPSDDSGRRWLVSFQDPKERGATGQSIGHASFVGLRFPR